MLLLYKYDIIILLSMVNINTVSIGYNVIDFKSQNIIIGLFILHLGYITKSYYNLYYIYELKISHATV